jgi:hypothetical protein
MTVISSLPWLLVCSPLEDRVHARLRRHHLALNRRFHAHDFWPEHAAAELRERWFSPEDLSASGLVVGVRGPDRFVEVGGEWTQPFIKRISRRARPNSSPRFSIFRPSKRSPGALT